MCWCWDRAHLPGMVVPYHLVPFWVHSPLPQALPIGGLWSPTHIHTQLWTLMSMGCNQSFPHRHHLLMPTQSAVSPKDFPKADGDDVTVISSVQKRNSTIKSTMEKTGKKNILSWPKPRTKSFHFFQRSKG